MAPGDPGNDSARAIRNRSLLLGKGAYIAAFTTKQREAREYPGR